MDKRTDEELVRQVQRGDVTAYEILVKRYQQKLLSFVYHIVGNEDEAKDIVQESLFNLYKTIDRIDSSKKFSSYIFVIAKNTALSYLRTRRNNIALDETTLAEEDSRLYEQLYASDEKKRIAKALRAIDKKYQVIIRLYYFEDLSYEEISKKIGLPMNTVRTHIKRAKDALRKVLIYETN